MTNSDEAPKKTWFRTCGDDESTLTVQFNLPSKMSAALEKLYTKDAEPNNPFSHPDTDVKYDITDNIIEKLKTDKKLKTAFETACDNVSITIGEILHDALFYGSRKPSKNALKEKEILHTPRLRADCEEGLLLNFSMHDLLQHNINEIIYDNRNLEEAFEKLCETVDQACIALLEENNATLQESMTQNNEAIEEIKAALEKTI